jgi:hypothetical protein
VLRSLWLTNATHGLLNSEQEMKNQQIQVNNATVTSLFTSILLTNLILITTSYYIRFIDTFHIAIDFCGTYENWAQMVVSSQYSAMHTSELLMVF